MPGELLGDELTEEETVLPKSWSLFRALAGGEEPSAAEARNPALVYDEDDEAGPGEVVDEAMMVDHLLMLPVLKMVAGPRPGGGGEKSLEFFLLLDVVGRDDLHSLESSTIVETEKRSTLRYVFR